MSPRVWLITGASSGFGETLTLKALSAGDKVIATSRSIGRLDKVKNAGAAVLALDHNQPLPELKDRVEEALKIYGGIDVLVNNAAYVQVGTLEESTPEETLTQFTSNVFGPLNLIRAILPHFRSKKSGIICNIGSMAAWTPFPGANLYDGSKAALRLLSLGLDAEVRPLGIKTCLVEPGYFRTELLAPGVNVQASQIETRIEDYRKANEAAEGGLGAAHGNQAGDPVKGSEVIFEVLTGTGAAEGKDVPRFIPLGSDACDEVAGQAKKIIGEVEEWRAVASSTDFPKA